MTIEYGLEGYWDKRYSKELAAFDWLFSWGDLSHLICELIPDHESKILLVGCGNAPFSPDMFTDGGYHGMINTDISKVVIAQQQQNYPEQNWQVVDATDMPYENYTFPVVIDKSLIDTLLCAKNSLKMTRKMLNEIYRVMKPGGRFVTFSLHSLEEVVVHYDGNYEGKRANPYPLFGWKVSAFRVRSSRWQANKDEYKKAVAHTLIVCDKPFEDGSYISTYPLRLDGVLSEVEHRELLNHAQEVQFRFAMEAASVKSLSVILNHVLAMSSPPSTYILKQLLGTAAPTPVINPDPHLPNRTIAALPLPPLPPTFVEDCEDLVKLYGDGILGIGHRIGDRPGGYLKKNPSMLSSCPPPGPAMRAEAKDRRSSVTAASSASAHRDDHRPSDAPLSEPPQPHSQRARTRRRAATRQRDQGSGHTVADAYQDNPSFSLNDTPL